MIDRKRYITVLSGTTALAGGVVAPEPPAPPPVVLVDLAFTFSSFSEEIANNTVISPILNAHPDAELSLLDDHGGRFKIVGTNLCAGPVKWNREVDGTEVELTVVQTLDGAVNSPHGTTVTFAVNNVFEVSLAALTLSTTNVYENVAAGSLVAVVNNRTGGSALAMTVTAGNSFALDGFGNVARGATALDYETTPGHQLSITIRESHPDAPAPGYRDTTFVMNILDWLAPVALSNPAISVPGGVAKQGAAAEAVPATWDYLPTSVTRRWLRDGTTPTGQTGLSYFFIGADVGHTLVLEETATNGEGSTTVTSTATAVVKATIEDTFVINAGEAVNTLLHNHVPDTGGVIAFDTPAGANLDLALQLAGGNKLKSVVTAGTYYRSWRYPSVGTPDMFVQAVKEAVNLKTWLIIAAIDKDNWIGVSDWTVSQINLGVRVGGVMDYAFVPTLNTAVASSTSGGTTNRILNLTASYQTTIKTLRMERVGNQIQLFINGALACTFTHAAIGAGGALENAARGGFALASSDAVSPLYSAFKCGSLSDRSVSVNDVPRILQRPKDGSNRAVALSGVYTSTAPTALEWRLTKQAAPNSSTYNVVPGYDWQALTGAVIGGLAWSGNVSIPPGGMYRVQVRAADATSIVGTSNSFGVGAIIFIDGQSNADGLGNAFVVGNAGTYGIAVDDRAWQYKNNQYSVPSTRVAAFCQAFAEIANFPVLAIITGHNSTALANIMPRADDPNPGTFPGGGYGTTYWDTDTLWTAQLPDFEGFLLMQGESDANSTLATTYKSNLDTVYDNTDGAGGYTGLKHKTGRTGAQMAFLVAAIGTDTSQTEVADNGWTRIRKAQYDWALAREAGGDLARLAMSCIDLSHPAGNGLHYDDAGYVEMGRRFARAYAHARGFLSGSDNYNAQGPRITGATRAGGVITLTLNMNGHDSLTADTPGGPLTGFYFTTNAALVMGNNTPNLMNADPALGFAPIGDYGGTASIVGNAIQISGGYAAANAVKLVHLWGWNPNVTNVARGNKKAHPNSPKSLPVLFTPDIITIV